jgi:mono/diheme cytochrome c family protein
VKAAPICGGLLWLTAALATAQDAGPEPGSTLPDEPAKGLVLVLCDKCHGLAWIERSGADEEGWTSRLRRMNRAGAMLSPEQMTILATYLARALPERPAPPTPPSRHSRQR